MEKPEPTQPFDPNEPTQPYNPYVPVDPPEHQPIPWRDPVVPAPQRPAPPPAGPAYPAPEPPAGKRVYVAPPPPPRYQPPPRRRRLGCGCVGCLPWLLIPLALLALYFLAPLRTNLLLLGIDRTPEGSSTGRSDTMILVSVIPLRPTVNMLSIPRDLWVMVPGHGENRINTAHFFAEAEQEGSGPAAAAAVVEDTFGVPVHYTVRVRFEGFTEVIRAMGGVTVTLDKPMAGYPPGEHTLDPDQALAFVRDRQGTDDFFRMEHTQLLLLSAARQMLSPAMWPKIPAVLRATSEVVDSSVPFWQWPRLGLALLRAGSTGGIDNRTLTRDMVNPFTTEGGAQVLGPNMDAIAPLIDELFR